MGGRSIAVPKQEPAVHARRGRPLFSHPGAGGRLFGLGLSSGGIAGDCAAGRLHSLAGEILATTVIVVPLVTGAFLVTVAVFGSTSSSDRVFRLLRWLRDSEEPPAPSPATTELG